MRNMMLGPVSKADQSWKHVNHSVGVSNIFLETIYMRTASPGIRRNEAIGQISGVGLKGPTTEGFDRLFSEVAVESTLIYAEFMPDHLRTARTLYNDAQEVQELRV